MPSGYRIIGRKVTKKHLLDQQSLNALSNLDVLYLAGLIDAWQLGLSVVGIAIGFSALQAHSPCFNYVFYLQLQEVAGYWVVNYGQVYFEIDVLI